MVAILLSNYDKINLRFEEQCNNFLNDSSHRTLGRVTRIDLATAQSLEIKDAIYTSTYDNKRLNRSSFIPHL